MSRFEFTDPWLLLLILFPAALPLWYRLSARRGAGTVPLSSLDWVPASAGASLLPEWLALLFRVAALTCLAAVAAGLRTGRQGTADAAPREAEVIVLDVSSSMTAEDFSPGNRLEAAKAALSDYVLSRRGTQLGLILLAASPRLAAPVTGRTGFLPQALRAAGPAGFGEDGTAIGNGIASATNRLRDGPWDRRGILLVTDGVNNRGALSPADASRIAANLGIRIDTIGIGTDQVARYWAPSAQGAPVEIRARIQIDDRALEEVSRITGGSYRHVTDGDALRQALADLTTLPEAPKAAAAVQAGFSWTHLLAAVSIFLICAEFVLSRFVSPQLPGP